MATTSTSSPRTLGCILSGCGDFCLFCFTKWSQTCSLLRVGGTSLPQAQPRGSETREIWEAWIILLNHWPGLKQMCFLTSICQKTFVFVCRVRWIKFLIFNWPLNQVTINACLLCSDINLHLTCYLFWKRIFFGRSGGRFEKVRLNIPFLKEKNIFWNSFHDSRTHRWP